MKKLLLLFTLFAPLAHAQVNLNSSIPAPQVKGIVQPNNGGFGLDTSSANGCPKVTAGVWTINPGNCSGTSAPLTINSFGGCAGALELGAHSVNPAFTASYSSTPTSANITNTDGISSPTNLTTPFTSGTVTGNFSHSTVATTTFTLSATLGSSSPTSTCTDTWNPRIFSGTGAGGGATGATASGTSAVLVGDTGTLPSFQLGAETVGTTFSFTLSSNYFYMLLVGSGHTFTVNGFPATLASTPVTFVNANGVSVSINLYVGPTFGTGVYTVVVTG